jgi:hypothetical protein
MELKLKVEAKDKITGFSGIDKKDVAAKKNGADHSAPIK